MLESIKTNSIGESGRRLDGFQRDIVSACNSVCPYLQIPTWIPQIGWYAILCHSSLEAFHSGLL